MSHDIELRCPTTGRVLQEAYVTYNYGVHLHQALGPGGVCVIYGLTGLQSIPVLAAGIAKLGTDVHPDYWQPTQGNARAALLNLVALASMGPEGVWHGD